MSTATLQKNLLVCQETIYIVQMPQFEATKFAEWLRSEFEKSPFKSYAQLAERTGVSRSHISALARSSEQLLTQKPSRPSSDLVIKLAMALNADVDQALQLAGHAPISGGGIRIDIDKDVKLILLDDDISSDDREEYDRAVTLAVAMARQRIAEKRQAQSHNEAFTESAR